MPEKQQCKGATYKRDTYRYTGRVKGGFEMHYTKRNCTRRQVAPYCWQHAKWHSVEMDKWRESDIKL